MFLDFLCCKLIILGQEHFQPLLNIIIFCCEPCQWRLCRHFKTFQIFSNQTFCCLAHKKVWILLSLCEHFVSLLFIEHCLLIGTVNFFIRWWGSVVFGSSICLFFIFAYLQIGISICGVGHLLFWKNVLRFHLLIFNTWLYWWSEMSSSYYTF